MGFDSKTHGPGRFPVKNKAMTASYKMRKAIERYEKKVGKMEKTFGVEVCEEMRVGKGFFDFVILTSPGFPGLTRTINHYGEIYR